MQLKNEDGTFREAKLVENPLAGPQESMIITHIFARPTDQNLQEQYAHFRECSTGLTYAEHPELPADFGRGTTINLKIDNYEIPTIALSRALDAYWQLTHLWHRPDLAALLVGLEEDDRRRDLYNQFFWEPASISPPQELLHIHDLRVSLEQQRGGYSVYLDQLPVDIMLRGYHKRVIA